MLNLMRILVKRLEDTARNIRRLQTENVRDRAVQPGLDQSPIAHRLAGALVNMGSKAMCWTRAAPTSPPMVQQF
jgi:hypothetical protein